MLYTNLITQLSNIVQMLFLIGFLVTISLKLTIFVIFTLVIIIGITLWKLKVLKMFSSKANSNIKLVSQLVSEQILFLKYVFVSRIQYYSLNKLIQKSQNNIKLSIQNSISNYRS